MDFDFTDNDFFIIFSTISTCYIAYLWMKRKKLRSRRFYCRPDNLNRITSGFYINSFMDIQSNDEEFFKFTRMTKPVYNLLLSLLKEVLSKKQHCYTISAESRLAITLSYLSQGVSLQFLGWSFKVGRSTAREIVLETCSIIWETLHPVYVSKCNEEDYKLIADEFNSRWNLPNCVGAIDGKHISIRCPHHSGSQYYNYKSFFSIVLLAACDARYCFTMVDLGGYGSQSDGGILAESIFGKKLFADKLELPPHSKLPKSDVIFPHYFIADPASGCPPRI